MSKHLTAEFEGECQRNLSASLFNST